MRVNITYSIELDEVPKLAGKLLAEATQNLETLFKKYKQISSELENENEKKATQTIDECRRLMATADHSLADCHSILTGYQQTLLKGEDPNGAVSEEPNDVLENG